MMPAMLLVVSFLPRIQRIFYAMTYDRKFGEEIYYFLLAVQFCLNVYITFIEWVHKLAGTKTTAELTSAYRDYRNEHPHVMDTRREQWFNSQFLSAVLYRFFGNKEMRFQEALCSPTRLLDVITQILMDEQATVLLQSMTTLATKMGLCERIFDNAEQELAMNTIRYFECSLAASPTSFPPAPGNSTGD